MKPDIERQAWHLDKTISVGHLLSTVIIAISVFSWASAVGRRVEQNAQAIKYLSKEQTADQHRLDALRSEIKIDLRNINTKLDRLIERQSGGR